VESVQLDPFLNSFATRLLAAAGAAAMIVGAIFVWHFDPARAGFFPACPLYSTTGYACPGCGLTRGFHALFHGDILTALDFNALIPLVMLFFGYIFASLVSVAIRGRGLVLGNWNLIMLWVTLGILVVFGVLRNLPFYPFNVLFP
jgi:hypothetical protein